MAGAEADYVSSLFALDLARLNLSRAAGEAETIVTESIERKAPMTPTGNQETALADQPAHPAAPKLPAPRPGGSAGRRRTFTIFFVVLLLVAAGVWCIGCNTRQFESTDDAFVEMHLDPISSRVDGTILKVYVEREPDRECRRSAGGSRSARFSGSARPGRGGIEPRRATR